SKTEGYADFVSNLDAISWDDILYASGLTRDDLTAAAEMIIASDRMITTWAMGITQHKDAVATIQDVVNLHLLRGQISKPGAGVCPVRGHSNVQGDRTMGIWEKVKDDFIEPLEKEFKFKAPRKEGFSTVKAIAAMHDGRAKVFFAMGGNFLSATPDTDVVFEALSKCDLTVQVATKLNRTALVPSKVSIILPCLGRSEIDVQASGEQFVSTKSTTLNVQMSKGILKPGSEHLRSESWIVAMLGKTVLGERSTVDWDAMAANYDNIRDSISRVVKGCEDYNKRVRVKGGFYLPNPPHEGEFKTKSGKAVFKASKLVPLRLDAGRFLLTTIRSHNQFNTTVYDYSDRYRGIEGERRVLFMNREDIVANGLKAGQVVDLTSHFTDGERHAERFIVVPYPIPLNCVAGYFPETNPLVPLGSVADKSETPTSKSLIVSITARNEFAGKFDDEVLAATA
ncbi:MAG TPA: molybdopterin-dependent oxidoreductase, partial [Pyrinomonadaceae bacterium]